MKMIYAFILYLCLCFSFSAKGYILETSLSTNLLKVTPTYDGSQITLIGSVETPMDIIIEVKGLPGEAKVYKKKNIFGFWINRSSVKFNSVPSYYSVAYSKAVQNMINPNILLENRMDVQSLVGLPNGKVTKQIDTKELLTFQSALIRNMEQQKRWKIQPRPIVFLGQHLFQAKFSFPPNAPIGAYEVNVYGVQNGRIVAAQSNSFDVEKTGLTAYIWETAQFHPLLYALMSLFIVCGFSFIFTKILNSRR